MTPKQASRALSALDGLVYRADLYAEIANVQNHVTAWEQEALFRLRGHLIAMLPEGDPQLRGPSGGEPGDVGT